MSISSTHIRKDFPIFTHDPSLVYLDSAATSLKPASMIQKMNRYYEQYTANIFRGLYKQSIEATEQFWQTRETTANFIRADSSKEIIFTRNTTESINLVAQTLFQYMHALGYARNNESFGITATMMDHHANFVPWQQMATRHSSGFDVIPVTHDHVLDIYKKDEQGIDEQKLRQYIRPSTKILTLPLVSNTLGTINPVREIIRAGKQIQPQLYTIVDAAQAAPHLPINVQDLGCDFLAFSAHKMLGPTGIGVLWGRYELLEQLPPYQYGGEMIQTVESDQSTFKEPPHIFEAGTPHIAGVIAFQSSLEYLKNIEMEKIHTHEKKISTYARTQLKNAFGDKIQLYSPPNPEHQTGVLSFNMADYHPHDVAHILSEENIAIRAGHHCTMPLHSYLNIPASCRASFYLYNGEEDVDKLVKGLRNVEKILR